MMIWGYRSHRGHALGLLKSCCTSAMSGLLHEGNAMTDSRQIRYGKDIYIIDVYIYIM